MQRAINNSHHRAGENPQQILNWASALAVMTAFILSLFMLPAHAEMDKYSFTIKDLQSSIAEALVKEGAGDAMSVTIANSGNSVIQRASAPMQLTVDFIDYDARTFRWEAEISIYAGDELAKREKLTGRYTALIEVPVAARRIFNGEVITESDITIAQLPEHRLRDQTIYRKSELVGKAARRSLRENQPISSHEIEAPIIAKRGDMLQITYRAPQIEIRTLAVALEDGAVGKNISVRNPSSNVVMRAVLVAPGIAEIRNHIQLSQNQYNQ